MMKEPDNIDTLVVHDRIGKGSYGVVYRGVLKPSVRERAVEIAVAAKVMPNESTEAAIVLREATLQQEAGSHPSIVGVIGCFHHEDSAWLLLELCSTSLHQVLRHRGILEEAQIAAVCAGTLRGLEWLHAKCRIVHRDIKCGNLLLSLCGEIKIADFGVACRREDDDGLQSAGGAPSPTGRAGTVIGSPLWMSPEMISDGLCDTPVDVWSLGICAIEMAELWPPHASMDPTIRAMWRIVNGPPPSLQASATKAWSNGFHAFVGSCLRKRPQQRAQARALVGVRVRVRVRVRVPSPILPLPLPQVPALLRSAWCAAAEAQGAQALLVPLLRPPEPFAPGRCSTADAAAAAAEGGERAATGELPPVLGFGARRRVARVRHAPAEHGAAEEGEGGTEGTLSAAVGGRGGAAEAAPALALAAAPAVDSDDDWETGTLAAPPTIQAHVLPERWIAGAGESTLTLTSSGAVAVVPAADAASLRRAQRLASTADAPSPFSRRALAVLASPEGASITTSSTTTSVTSRPSAAPREDTPNMLSPLAGPALAAPPSPKTDEIAPTPRAPTGMLSPLSRHGFAAPPSPKTDEIAPTPRGATCAPGAPSPFGRPALAPFVAALPSPATDAIRSEGGDGAQDLRGCELTLRLSTGLSTSLADVENQSPQARLSRATPAATPGQSASSFRWPWAPRAVAPPAAAASQAQAQAQAPQQPQLEPSPRPYPSLAAHRGSPAREGTPTPPAASGSPPSPPPGELLSPATSPQPNPNPHPHPYPNPNPHPHPNQVS